MSRHMDVVVPCAGTICEKHPAWQHDCIAPCQCEALRFGGSCAYASRASAVVWLTWRCRFGGKDCYPNARAPTRALKFETFWKGKCNYPCCIYIYTSYIYTYVYIHYIYMRERGTPLGSFWRLVAFLTNRNNWNNWNLRSSFQVFQLIGFWNFC